MISIKKSISKNSENLLVNLSKDELCSIVGGKPGYNDEGDLGLL